MSTSAGKPPPPEISVVVPIYRTVDTLRPLYDRLRRVLEGHSLSFELVFVDDGCPDGSLAVLRELAASDSRVAVVALPRNMGQHRAILAGLRQARGNRVVVLDADLQDPPEAIPDLLNVMDAGAGAAAVFAGRRGRYESRLRLLSSRLFKTLLHLLCGVPPDAGLFVAMDRRMIERLLAFQVSRPFLVALIGCSGLPLASIPVVRSPRPSGRSAYNFWKRLRNACGAIAWVLAWRWRRRTQPNNTGTA